jgi:hypothetical protein
MGAIYFGLIVAPDRMVKIQNDQLTLEMVRGQRGCEFAAQNTISNIVAQAQKAKQNLNQELLQIEFIKKYNTCLYLQGLEMFAKPVPALPKAAQTPANIKVEEDKTPKEAKKDTVENKK